MVLGGVWIWLTATFVSRLEEVNDLHYSFMTFEDLRVWILDPHASDPTCWSLSENLCGLMRLKSTLHSSCIHTPYTRPQLEIGFFAEILKGFRGTRNHSGWRKEACCSPSSGLFWDTRRSITILAGARTAHCAGSLLLRRRGSQPSCIQTDCLDPINCRFYVIKSY